MRTERERGELAPLRLLRAGEAPPAAGTGLPADRAEIARRWRRLDPAIRDAWSRPLDALMVDQWLGAHRPGSRPAYSGVACALGQALRRPLAEVTAADLREWVDQQTARIGLPRRSPGGRGGGLAPATVRLRASAVRSLFHHLRECGYVRWNVAAALPPVDAAPPLAADRILSEDQVRRLVATARGRDQLLLRFLFSTGCRLAEAAGVRPADLLRGPDGQVLVRLRGKGGRVRDVPLPPGLREDLLAHAAGLDLQEGLWGVGYSGIRKLVARVARRAQLPRVSPHWLRHAHATAALAHGAPLRTVQETMGHASSATTAIYLHVAEGDASSLYVPDPTARERGGGCDA